jgi:nuclear transport factor 2 (NTF2) superfamily protein
VTLDWSFESLPAPVAKLFWAASINQSIIKIRACMEWGSDWGADFHFLGVSEWENVEWGLVVIILRILKMGDFEFRVQS